MGWGVGCVALFLVLCVLVEIGNEIPSIKALETTTYTGYAFGLVGLGLSTTYAIALLVDARTPAPRLEAGHHHRLA